MSNTELHNGDCLEVMAEMASNSIDAIVTDPPYGLSFMNKGWDKGVPTAEYWAEALRVAKPGAMLFAFGGTRMFHRLMVAIEDAGWEIRDTIMWVYGSGFPKSANISKLIDKELGAERESFLNPLAKKQTASKGTNAFGDYGHKTQVSPIPASPEAQQWDGYGTALKPAWEPIIFAMKPIDGTYANNAVAHGVAGINIEACRVDTDEEIGRKSNKGPYESDRTWSTSTTGPLDTKGLSSGRWPANFIHDGSDEVVALFPNVGAGGSVSGKEPSSRTGVNAYGESGRTSFSSHNDAGSAARFFYCAKASQYDRDLGLGTNRKTSITNDGREKDIDNAYQRGVTQRKNNHPTVKPTELMRYLVRLVSMPDGSKILDPFMGSGSTGVACVLEGQSFVGIEKDRDHVKLASERIEGVESLANLQWKKITDTSSSYDDMPLFQQNGVLAS